MLENQPQEDAGALRERGEGQRPDPRGERPADGENPRARTLHNESDGNDQGP